MPATTQEEVLSGILPRVFIDKITLNNNSDNTSLKVTLNLIIKEMLENDQVGTWFNDINILKYVRIQVIQSKSALVTRGLSYSNDIISIVDLLDGRNFSANDLRIRGFALQTQALQMSAIRDLIESNVESKLISLSLNNFNNNTLENFSAYKNNDGNLIYEIPYEISFDLTDTKPEHLAYFAVSRIDLQELMRDFRINYDIAESIEENGRVSSEIVFDQYNIVDKSYIYVDKNGYVWDGAVHLGANNEWKSGDDETVNSIPLAEVLINNNKVQDFRNIQEIQRLILDLNQLEISGANVFDLSKVATLNFNYIPEKEEPIFSELMCSHDAVNDKILFAIDFNNAIKQYSPLGSLFDSKNDLLKREILNRSKILNLDVTFKRVERNVNTKNDVAEYGTKDFENGNSPLDREITIASAKENSWKNLISDVQTSYLSGFLKEEEIHTSTQSQIPSYSIRYFSCVNTLINRGNRIGINTSGLYKYGVNLEIEDGTVKFIVEKIVQLNESKNRLLNYYNKIITPTMKNFILESSDPLINSIELGNTTKSEFISYGFDVVANKISNEFATKLENDYGVNNSPWVNEPPIFVDALQTLMLSPVSQQNIENYVGILCNFLNPRSGNPSSVNKVIELYDYFISSLSRLVKINPNTPINEINREGTIISTNGSFPLLKDKSPSERETRAFKISKIFDNIIDCDNLKKIGVDYLNYSYNDGIPVLNQTIFTERIKNEIDKFFISFPRLNLTVDNTLINLNNTSTGDRASYLTPAKFIMPTRRFITSQFVELQNNDSNTNIHLYEQDTFERVCRLLSDLAEIKLQNSVVNVNSQTIYSENNPNVFANITTRQRTSNDLEELFENHGGVTFTRVITPPSIQDTATISQQNSNTRNIVADPTTTREERNLESILKFFTSLVFPISKQKIMSFGFSNKSQDKKEFLYNYDYEDSIKKILQLDLTRLNDKTINELKKLPYQIQALALKSREFTQFINKFFDYSNFNSAIESRTLNYINFENIMKIEYLDNFFINDSVSTNITNDNALKINIKRPTWKLLTEESYSRINSQTNILCRLSPYENKHFKLSVNQDITESVYDKYFLLVGPIIPPAGPGRRFSRTSTGQTGFEVPPRMGGNSQTMIDVNTLSEGFVSNVGKKIIDSLTSQLGNVSIKNMENLSNIKDIPKNIEITITDNSGNKIKSSITKQIKTSDISSATFASLKAHSISLNVQTKSIKNTSTTNNLINNTKIRNIPSRSIKR